MDLRGAVAVVTGASSGFGELTSRMLAKEGAAVVLAARRAERLEALAAEIEGRGGRALAVRCDVTEVADLQGLRDRVDEAFGRCDVLINNAGIPGGGRFEDLSLEQIEQVIRVNLLGVLVCTKVFLPMMLDRQRGHIVNVGSLAGRYAAPGASVYSASKHGVVAFSEALYYELAPRGILVTSVNPGFAATEGFPQGRLPSALVMRADRVARVIVDVIKEGRAPEVSVPRGMSLWQAFRVLTPPLYRWGVRTATGRLGTTPAKSRG
ncbi:MAG: SDR family NAD(P)-dependent oxidoreductase [Actinobacteria bacterium]|nr:MAG: SDR family NAD(P)-dependent oxidoreductase [Actinomycetota bacterium]